MLIRIIRIDKEKCNGCGACAKACHEGAIDMIDGKAELVREHFCDGLGVVFRNVRQAQSPLKKERRQSMMRKP